LITHVSFGHAQEGYAGVNRSVARSKGQAAKSALGPNPPREGYSQSTAALPGTSDVEFLGDLKHVIDLNAEGGIGVIVFLLWHGDHQTRFQIDQAGGHHQIIGSELQPQFLSPESMNARYCSANGKIAILDRSTLCSRASVSKRSIGPSKLSSAITRSASPGSGPGFGATCQPQRLPPAMQRRHSSLIHIEHPITFD
jgi:hypothetical protein